MANIYELAFHLDPSLEEASVVKIKEDIERSIISNGGAISFSKEPEKIKLSYPIKDQKMSYFGYIHFNVDESSRLKQIQEHVMLSQSILRFLILKLETDSQKQKDAMKRMALGERARKSRAASQKAESDKAAESPVQEAELEKKLEEIIEKL